MISWSPNSKFIVDCLSRKENSTRRFVCLLNFMKRPKWIRVIALVCIVLLVGMYAATFITALLAKQYANTMFLGCLVCTVFVPVFLFIMIRLFSYMTRKKEGETTLYKLNKAKKEQRKQEK